MASGTFVYLVDVSRVPMEQRDSVRDTLKRCAFMVDADYCGQLAVRRFFAYCDHEISLDKLSLPPGCRWRDITGLDVVRIQQEHLLMSW